MKSAIQLRVLAPAVNPSPVGVYQAPAGGVFKSTGPEGGTIEETSNARILSASAKDLGNMERVAARAAKRHIRGDVNVVRRDLGAARRTGDLHEFEEATAVGFRVSIAQTGGYR